MVQDIHRVNKMRQYKTLHTVTAFISSPNAVRQGVQIPVGTVVENTTEELRVGYCDSELVGTFSINGKEYELIYSTHFGTTPFAQALQYLDSTKDGVLETTINHAT